MGVDFGGDQFYLQGCYNLYMHEKQFQKTGFTRGAVFGEGLSTRTCLYEGHCFKKMVFIRGAAFDSGFISMEMSV